MKKTLESVRRTKLNKIQWQYSYNSELKKLSIKDFVDEPENSQITLSGRVTALRLIGKIAFLQLSDVYDSVQIILDHNTCDYHQILEIVDIGDIFTIEGTVGFSNTKEKSVFAHKCVPRRKALLPLPDKWNKLSELDIVRRQRYLDLIMSQETRDRFFTRLKVISLIRKFFFSMDYQEVETPILQPVASGAAATPFVTHHNALDIDLFLRIAPELFLKRLTIAGYPKIFEIGKCFRNEGVDSTHLQEFTMLEMYEAFASYEDLQNIGSNLVLFIINSVSEKNITTIPKCSYKEFLSKNGLDITTLHTYEDLIPIAQENNVPLDKYPTYQILLDQLYKKLCVKNVKDPILVYDYPASPLAKKSDTDENYGEQFQIIMEGCEIVKAYLEQNDPDIQQDEFNKQKKELEQGNLEAVANDDEYIDALMYGLPPTGGLGLGIDRLVQIITNCDSIKDIVFFPNMKHK